MVNLLVNKKFLIISIGAAILLLLLLLFLSWLRQKKMSEESKPQSKASRYLNFATPTPAGVGKKSLPRTFFKKYTLKAALPNVAPEVSVYRLAGPYTKDAALRLGQKIGFVNPKVEEKGRRLRVFDRAEAKSSGYLTLDSLTGSLFFASDGRYGQQVISESPVTKAKKFLSLIGFFDEYLEYFASYKKSDFKDVVFVEFHRSWEKLGLPLLNIVGTLNIREDVRLSSLKLGYISSEMPDDPSIIFSSDGQAGKVRPNDFNTITVSVSEKDNKILTVFSNLRKIQEKVSLKSASELKSPQQAFSELADHKSTFSLTIPTGEGIVDQEKLYLNNQAVAQEAVVEDFSLTYLEDFSNRPMKELTPYYIFRGTTVLDTGYRVQFVEAVPALKRAVLGETSDEGTGTIQYGTFFQPSPAPTLSVTPEVASPTPNLTTGPTSTPPPSGGSCPKFSNEYRVDEGYIAWYPPFPPRFFYYVPDDQDSGGEPGTRELFQDVVKAMQACPPVNFVCPATAATLQARVCYFISPASPSIYFYTKDPRNIVVSLAKDMPVTYSDPPFSNSEKVWSFKTMEEGLLSFKSGLTTRRLYYEYDKKSFVQAISSLKTDAGAFVVEKAKLKEFIGWFSQEVGLKQKEEDDLTKETERETQNISARYLIISLLDRSVIDQLLPISILPVPSAFYRIHLLIRPARAVDRSNVWPKLPKIFASGIKDFTAIELGVIVE